MTEVEVLKEYKKILKLIEDHMGNDTTYSNDLDELGRLLIGRGYVGTFSRDDLPNMRHGQCCIMNVDTRDQGGSHWVSVYKTSKNNVYDSFGRKSSKLLDMKGTIDSDPDAEQKMKELDCGQRCLSWLLCVKYFGIKSALKI